MCLEPVSRCLGAVQARCGRCGGHLGDLFLDGFLWVGGSTGVRARVTVRGRGRGRKALWTKACDPVHTACNPVRPACNLVHLR